MLTERFGVGVDDSLDGDLEATNDRRGEGKVCRGFLS